MYNLNTVNSNKSFHDYVVGDLLYKVSNLHSRKMFSGYGLYQDDTMFGLIIQGVLYYKVDQQNQPKFIRRNSQPFSYLRKDGSKTALSFCGWIY